MYLDTRTSIPCLMGEQAASNCRNLGSGGRPEDEPPGFLIPSTFETNREREKERTREHKKRTGGGVGFK